MLRFKMVRRCKRCRWDFKSWVPFCPRCGSDERDYFHYYKHRRRVPWWNPFKWTPWLAFDPAKDDLRILNCDY